MNRSPYSESFTMSPEVTTFFGLIQGAGAAPPVIPTTVFSGTSSKGYMTAANNYVSGIAGDITRTGAGQYTVKFKDSIPVMVDITTNVWGPNGTWSTMVDYNPTTRVATLLVFAPAGTAVDLAATEFLRFTATGQFSVFP